MSRFKLVFSEAVRSIGANLSTSIAATMTVLIGMFLLGLFIALGTWVVSWSDHVKSELQIRVIFLDDVTPKQVNKVGAYLGADSQISEYHFVSRAEALKDMEKRYPNYTKNVASNPFPASFEVTPADANSLKEISGSSTQPISGSIAAVAQWLGSTKITRQPNTQPSDASPQGRKP